MAEFRTPARNPKIQNKLLQKVSGTPGVNSPMMQLPATPFLKKLGFGTGVSVYLYERSPQAGAVRSPWAMKKINKRHAASIFGDRLEEEANVLKSLSHPNIIGYRAFKKGADGVHTLVMESGQKSLFDHIEERCENEEGPFPAEEIEKVIRGIASALDYLHTEKHLMHGDMKSGNILVVGEFDAVKLCDFGVTLPVNSEGKTCDPKSDYVGTEAWSAKEVISGGIITTKADIFSLGLVIYEMLALHGPHMDKLGLDDTAASDVSDKSLDDAAFREALGTRPPLPEDVELDETYRTVLELFFFITNEDPEKRPSAREILKILDEAESSDGDDSVLCVNMVEGESLGDESSMFENESSMFENESSMLSEAGDDSVVCVDIVEAPSAV